MTLPPEIAAHLQHASGVALARAIEGMEGFVSSAVGQPISITSGPAGQIVVTPKTKRLPKNPARPAGNILLPLLIGSAVMALSKREPA